MPLHRVGGGRDFPILNRAVAGSAHASGMTVALPFHATLWGCTASSRLGFRCSARVAILRCMHHLRLPCVRSKAVAINMHALYGMYCGSG